ncbi:unnamed protein product [Nippostrongylus brasiliensis]|uniref:Nanos-type domain-containing protein n=1 Tax=Nippostrongylus brasiliensis TaxID=27835 RepID=A0A0N4YCN9_NIPBR|nr:unnamed protein product [Nippostrongylus brasiliensis]
MLRLSLAKNSTSLAKNSAMLADVEEVIPNSTFSTRPTGSCASYSRKAWTAHRPGNGVQTDRYQMSRCTETLNRTQGACGYCKSVGKRFDGHSKNTCPELFALKPCSLCGADGFDNHTLTHCPSQQKVKLELKRDHRRRVDSKQMEGLLRFNGSAATDRSDVLLFCDEYR